MTDWALRDFGLAVVDTPAKMRDWLLGRAATALDTATTEQIRRFSDALWKKNDRVIAAADLEAPPGSAPKLCDAFASEVYQAMIRQLGSAATVEGAATLADTVALQMRQELCPSIQLLLVAGPATVPPPKTSPATDVSTAPHSQMVIYLVRRGDSLWSIAAARLPASSSMASIESAWRRIWAANRAVIGPDPNVLLPGQELLLGTASGP